MICFICPAKIAGGVQSLVIAVCKELSKASVDYCIFDYKWSHVYRSLVVDEKIKIPVFIDLDEEKGNKNLGCMLTKNDVLIGFNDQFYLLYKYFSKSKARFILWDVYYPFWKDFLSLSIKGARLYTFKKDRIDFLQSLIQHNALFFMDYNGPSMLENWHGFHVDQPQLRIIPVPIIASKTIKINRRRNNGNNEMINTAYIGRAVDWKVKPIEKVIKDSLMHKHIKFYIITDSKKKFIKYFDEIEEKVIEDRVLFIENLYGEKLSGFLKKHISLIFGMGTACLEGAKLGIPSVLVDFSSNRFPAKYNYKWIYMREPYCLGKDIADMSHAEIISGYSFREIINQITNKEDLISHQSLDYVKKYYDSAAIVSKLIDASNKSSFFICNLSNFKSIRYINIKRNIGHFFRCFFTKKTSSKLKYREY